MAEAKCKNPVKPAPGEPTLGLEPTPEEVLKVTQYRAALGVRQAFSTGPLNKRELGGAMYNWKRHAALEKLHDAVARMIVAMHGSEQYHTMYDNIGICEDAIQELRRLYPKER